jgi:hypothetical protein
VPEVRRMRLVDPSDIPSRGTIDYDYIDKAVNNGKAVLLPQGELGLSPDSLRSMLSSHVRRHDLPWKITQRKGDIYVSLKDDA